MIREYKLQLTSPDCLFKLLRTLAVDGHPFVLRNSGIDRISQESIFNTLNGFPFLTLDNRHFDSSSRMEYRNWWEITNLTADNNTYAHSTGIQPFHSDNAWFPDPAAINCFYMQKQALQGGDQLIIHITDLIFLLKRDKPQLFNDLKSTIVTIKKGDNTYMNVTPILSSKGIFWNYYRISRSSSFVSDMCNDFFDYLSSLFCTRELVTQCHLDSGDLLFMHDQLSLHARTSFKAIADRERILLQSMWQVD